MLFRSIYDKTNTAVHSENSSNAMEITVFSLPPLWFLEICHICQCKIREMLLAETLTQLIVTHIRKDAHHCGKSEGALACELQYQPHWGLWADLLISVQGVNESSSEGWGTVHPACPSLLPVLAMNMELFCGWELAYVFCLISRPHSHFKGRSTRGLDFLICLATESTTCMWDQLPVRADNPTASKYTYSPPTLSSHFIALHYPPSFNDAASSPIGQNWVWSCIQFLTALTMKTEMFTMFHLERPLQQ